MEVAPQMAAVLCAVPKSCVQVIADAVTNQLMSMQMSARETALLPNPDRETALLPNSMVYPWRDR